LAWTPRAWKGLEGLESLEGLEGLEAKMPKNWALGRLVYISYGQISFKYKFSLVYFSSLLISFSPLSSPPLHAAFTVACSTSFRTTKSNDVIFMLHIITSVASEDKRWWVTLLFLLLIYLPHSRITDEPRHRDRLEKHFKH
jgi:hypothetical protein